MRGTGAIRRPSSPPSLREAPTPIPTSPKGLGGQAIGEYAAGLFTAFPDLSFDVISHHATGDGTVAARWLMRGTNTGSLRGNPPTGATVALPGADFIAVEGDKVRSVDGYFDRRAFVEQLGLQVIVQPYSAGPFSFGYSVRAQSGELTKPGPLASPGYRLAPEKRSGRYRSTVVPSRRRWSKCPASSPG